MIRALARAAARVLPAGAKAGLARWRFGHRDAGPRIHVERRREDGGRVRYTIDRTLTFVASAEGAGAVEYHFVRDGDSRAEMVSFMRVSAAAPADGLLLDIGAHVGLFGVVHLALAQEHRALLFEPSPILSSESAEWLRLAGLADRGEARRAGVGDSVETRLVGIDALGFASMSRDSVSGVAVPFTTIDDVCRTDGLSPAIIKVDVEGYEAEVLRGARETLRRDRPILCLELHLDMLEQRGKLLAPLLGELEAAGYEFQSTEGARLSAAQLSRSLKAVLRVVARPAGRPA
jgi:FkbM family methyltransferase